MSELSFNNNFDFPKFLQQLEDSSWSSGSGSSTTSPTGPANFEFTPLGGDEFQSLISHGSDELLLGGSSSSSDAAESSSSSSPSSSSSSSVEHRCHLCNELFAFSLDFRTHLKTHGSQKTFPCHKCNTVLPSTTKLWQHIAKTHLPVKPDQFFCTICRRHFKQSCNYHQHMLIHIGEQPEVCRFCGKTFRTRPSLKKHEMIHTGQKPFQCDQCPNVFKTRDELKQHAISHSTEKLYQCLHCRGQFKYQASLKRHEKKGRCKIGKHWCPLEKKNYKKKSQKVAEAAAAAAAAATAATAAAATAAAPVTTTTIVVKEEKDPFIVTTTSSSAPPPIPIIAAAPVAALLVPKEEPVDISEPFDPLEELERKVFALDKIKYEDQENHSNALYKDVFLGCGDLYTPPSGVVTMNLYDPVFSF